MNSSSNLIIDIERARDDINTRSFSVCPNWKLKLVQLLVRYLDRNLSSVGGGDTTGLFGDPWGSLGGIWVPNGAVQGKRKVFPLWEYWDKDLHEVAGSHVTIVGLSHVPSVHFQFWSVDSCQGNT